MLLVIRLSSGDVAVGW